MDVSIAVSLIRGQMGAVVERAVNGAVETVLAEMLKVVGVKFEELKAQVALMKRDITTLQREKALKEKENDNIRAKLRYTELKLKYYRQGVEEELQQRTSASTLVRIAPSNFHKAHKGGAGVCSIEKSPSCSTEARSSEGPLIRNSQECPSPHSMSRRVVGVHSDLDAGVASLDPSVSLAVNTPKVTVDSSTVLLCATEQDTVQSKDCNLDKDVCEWTVTRHPNAEAVDDVEAPPVQGLTGDLWQQPVTGSLSPDVSLPADSSIRPSSSPQVKQEVEEVICIKEEPEDEQEVIATLLDCQMQQGHLPESQAQSSVSQWSEHPANQRLLTTTFSSVRPNSYAMPQPVSSLSSMVDFSTNIAPQQGVRPWTKDLSLYEEYKLRRNELRRRSLNRRRELEKTLPQPLLADMVRERREKTRLRVARWRAKRKLQACLNQAQSVGGGAVLSQSGTSAISSQPQPHRGSCAAASSTQYSVVTQSSSFLGNMATSNSISASLPFMSSTSSPSTLLLRGPNMATTQHSVTSSSSPYPQVGLSQPSVSLTGSDILQ